MATILSTLASILKAAWPYRKWIIIGLVIAGALWWANAKWNAYRTDLIETAYREGYTVAAQRMSARVEATRILNDHLTDKIAKVTAEANAKADRAEIERQDREQEYAETIERMVREADVGGFGTDNHDDEKGRCLLPNGVREARDRIRAMGPRD